MSQIVLASNNEGKIRELNSLFADTNYQVIGQSAAGVVGEAIEDGTTFVENAIKKARYAAHQSGLPAIADDSGLCIRALNGQPGLRSARFSLKDQETSPTDRSIIDRANNEKVLQLLKNTSDRSAYFICLIVLLRHEDDPDPIISRGVWQGHITDAPTGTEGFGYDPIFIGEGMNVSAAQLTKSDKNAVSHRGKAVKELKSFLA